MTKAFLTVLPLCKESAGQFKREAHMERTARDISLVQLLYLARGDSIYGKPGNEKEDLRALRLI